MRIETTVTLGFDCLEKLNQAARSSGRQRNALVAAIMHRVMREHPLLVKSSGCVRYQEGAGDAGWRRMHVTMATWDYDYFQDMRKFFRCSVSFLVALAIDRHLWSVLAKMADGNYNVRTDNYRFNHYLCMVESVEGSICWRIYWGFPPDLTELFARNTG